MTKLSYRGDGAEQQRIGPTDVGLPRMACAACLLAYLAALLDLTLREFRQPGALTNLVPFATIGSSLQHGLRDMAWNVFGNLAAFVPLGFLAPILLRGRATAAGMLTLSAALSLLIEGLQYRTGERVADVDDVLLNAAGGLLGYLAWALVGRLRGAGTIPSARPGREAQRPSARAVSTQTG